MFSSTDRMQFILATDVGSTTTKARFFQRKAEGWRFVVAGEAPTTVEAPFEDVTMGVMNAIREIEEITGHRYCVRIPLESSRRLTVRGVWTCTARRAALAVVSR